MMKPRREIKKSPRFTLLDLVRECPGVLLLILIVWGLLALLSWLLPKVPQ